MEADPTDRIHKSRKKKKKNVYRVVNQKVDLKIENHCGS